MVFNIMRYSTHDGPGIRTTVFLKGCPLSCVWCHNPESQRPNKQVMYSAARCVRCGECIPHCPHGALSWSGEPVRDAKKCAVCGECAEFCPADARSIVGRKIAVADLVKDVEKDRVFFEASGGGVTFSGGEPFYQIEFLEHALVAFGQAGLHRVVDTCGYVQADTLLRLSSQIDLFLYDLKMLDEARHKALTGVSNRLILENLKALAARRAEVIVRMPVIHGVNDDAANLQLTRRFLADLGLSRIDLLPYHEIGMDKYARLGAKPPSEALSAPSGEEVQQIAAQFVQEGFAVRIGG